MVAINTDRLQDATLVLHDSVSAITADALCTVGGSAAAGIVDIGAADAAFDVQIDISGCDVASNDENYEIQILGSNSASFASGIVLLGVCHLGALEALVGGTGGIDTDKNTGTHILTVRNRINDTVYRYVRANVEVAGTTPSIAFSAYISNMQRA